MLVCRECDTPLQKMKVEKYFDVLNVYYCKECDNIAFDTSLNPIGKGTERIVFELNTNIVLKVAMNKNGFLANEYEFTLSITLEDLTKVIQLPRAYDSSINWLWIEVERCAVSEEATRAASNVIPCVDIYSKNAGINKNGELCLVDYGGRSFIDKELIIK